MSKLSMYDRRKIAMMADQGLQRTKIASSLGVSRPTVYKWLKAYWEEGESVFDSEKSSKPHNSPQKLDQRLWRRIVLLAWRHPDKGLQWYAENTGNRTSTTTIHNILKQLGLGSKNVRLELVLRGNIKSLNTLTRMSKMFSDFPQLLNCYSQRGRYADERSTEYICIEMSQRLRYSSRKYHFLFLIDTYDMTIKVVINDTRFFSAYHHLELQTVLEQNNLSSFYGHRLLPEILTWNKFLKEESGPIKFIQFSFVEDEYPKHYSTLAQHLEPLSIPVSVESRKTVHAIPWIRSFIDRFKAFQQEVLNKKLFYDRYERRDVRLKRCTNLLDEFLDEYNNKPIDLYPFFGESPNSFGKSELEKRIIRQNFSTVEQLRKSRDKSQPLINRPSLESILQNLMVLQYEEQDIITASK